MDSWVNLRPSSGLNAAARQGIEAFRQWFYRNEWKPLIGQHLRGSSPSGSPEKHHRFYDASTMGAEAVVDHDHEHGLVLYVRGTAYDLHTVRSRKGRAAVLRERASLELTIAAAERTFDYRMRAILGQITGIDPVLDAAGNTLSGDAAITRRIELYNDWGCRIWTSNTIDGKRRPQRIAEQAVAWLAEETAKTPSVPEARELQLERFDDHVAARAAHLFDGPAPHNQDQQAALYEMLGHRQTLGTALKGASTAAAAKAAGDTAITGVNGVNVRWSPQWFAGVAALTSGVHADTYTTGSTPWAIVLSVRNTGGTPTEHGPVTVESLPDSDDFGFAVVSQDTTSKTITVTRKSGVTGHPAAGTYVLPFTVRNHKGPSTLKLTVTVPAPTPSE